MVSVWWCLTSHRRFRFIDFWRLLVVLSQLIARLAENLAVATLDSKVPSILSWDTKYLKRRLEIPILDLTSPRRVVLQQHKVSWHQSHSRPGSFHVAASIVQVIDSLPGSLFSLAWVVFLTGHTTVSNPTRTTKNVSLAKGTAGTNGDRQLIC
ncbi:hypothetical protein ElyMa_000890600 [Elysia marginata]|uniref:Secreted protein n=1 Tax=Elysia marginata TaxID=1093978 RepID=A0AAV4H6H3_9GAST|nr:hypothetical protein ElyMa_000890600 [Elysia marginata]